MVYKIFCCVLATALTVLAVTFGIVFGFTYDGYSRLALEDMHRECVLVHSALEEYGSEYLSVLDADKVRVTYVLADGRVSFDSAKTDLDQSENYLDREEILEAIRDGEGSAIRFSGSSNTNTAYYAMRLSDGSVIRVSAEHYSPTAVFLNVLQPALVLLVLVVAFALLIALYLSRRIVKPINEMDFDNPSDGRIFDELKPVVARLEKQNRRIKRQMRELSRRRSEFNSITANMSEGMILLNSRADVLSCNRSASEILGIEREGVCSILAASRADELREPVLCALGGKNADAVITSNGRHYQLLVTPVQGEEGVVGAVIMVIDVTEREEREELRRSFTANVSHELKTPLTSISGFAELIRDGIADGDDARRFAGNIYKEASRLITLVGDIIKLNQVDGGELPFDGEVNLSLICRQVADRLEPIAKSAGVELSVRGNSSAVMGNRQLLEEMVYNLADNAIKYNKPGGWVTVATEASRTGATLTVSDNGIGIPKGEQDRVFERFYRVDKSHSRQIGGTGLGLSIVKHIAAYHSAKISLDSEEGVGTSVSLSFPAVDDGKCAT